MKQKEVFNKIGTIIKEINDQYNYLVENEDELNDLELELFVANAHFLADHSEVLRKLSLNKPAPVKAPPASELRFFEPVVQQSAPPAPSGMATAEPKPDQPVPHIDLRGDDTGTDYSYIRQEPEIIRHELQLEDIPQKDEQEKVAAAIQRPAEEPRYESPKMETTQPPDNGHRKQEHSTDQEKSEPLTINQRISAQLKTTSSRNTEHVSAQPVSDLKQSITLNDKLLYIKDLFNGYNLAYSEAIDILNRFNSFDEADNFLRTSYAAKNHWENKQATVDKFYDLLRRRY